MLFLAGADHGRCEKTKWTRRYLPDTAVSLKKGDFNTLPAIHSIIGNSGFCAILNKKADNT